jgi:hypothetical protein
MGPHFLIFLFSPPYILFWAFFKHNWSLRQPRKLYSEKSLNGKGGSIFEGPTPIKKIRARLFNHGLSRIKDIGEL